jgi:hypothetical protein
MNIGTMPSGWWPTVEFAEGAACSGFGDGGANISTTGNVTLRTWSANGTIKQNDHNVRMNFSYIQ